jgi:hypothetical protein
VGVGDGRLDLGVPDAGQAHGVVPLPFSRRWVAVLGPVVWPPSQAASTSRGRRAGDRRLDLVVADAGRLSPNLA